MNPAPYPSDTRAKGWRFELDLERVRQSDTWALNPAEARPWLFMLWTEAWTQVPCGSLPADDSLIAARIGMPPKLFAKHRATLMRGWWQADDGRLYHSVITEHVLSMLKRKDAEKTRKAEYRTRMDAERALRPTDVPRDTTGTDAGLHRPSGVCDATGTGTGTRTRTGLEETHTLAVTDAGRVCLLLKAQGVSDVNPGHPDLRMLLDAGATDAEFIGAATSAASRGKGFAYTLGTLKRQRQEAANAASTLHRGALPNKQEAVELRNSAVGDAWVEKMQRSMREGN